jgi:glyoxylase-like metal-dependent hydrolase (beta-lactamase superfamily II)
MIRDWFLPGLLETGPVDDRIMAVQDGLVNFYVVKGPDGLVCVDAGWRPRRVKLGFEALGLEMRDVAAVFLTHGHWDHARCADLYPNAQVFAGGEEDRREPGKRPPPTRARARVHDGQVVTAAGLPLRVIASPGHTPDSLCYVMEGRFLFTGDALRLRRGKAAPFPRKFKCDLEIVKRSIRKLARIQGIERLLTAHSGTTCDVEAAFQDWREEKQGEIF